MPPASMATPGRAYLIPGRAGLTGTFSLSTRRVGSTLAASSSCSPRPARRRLAQLLRDVGLRPLADHQTNTADLDNMGDFIIGSPGYDVTQNSSRLPGRRRPDRPRRAHHGARFQRPTPSPPRSASASRSLRSASTRRRPPTLQIFVFGSTTTTPELHAGHRHRSRRPSSSTASPSRTRP